MFESAELGHRVAKRSYAKEEPKVRAALLDAQMAVLSRADFPIVLLSGGVDGGGKGEGVGSPRGLRASSGSPRRILGRSRCAAAA